MSESVDRLSAIQQVYQDALDNEPDDLAAAQTAADVTAVQANLASAKAAYYGALAAALATNSGKVEQAYAAVQAASAAVQAARASAGDIATLLGKLNKATEAANTLLGLASGKT